MIIDEPYINFYFDTAYITVGIGLEDACGLECKSMEKYLVKQKAFLSPQISAQEVNSFPSFISSLFAAWIFPVMNDYLHAAEEQLQYKHTYE